MSSGQDELDKEAIELEKKKMEITKKVIEEKVNSEQPIITKEIIKAEIPSLLTQSLREILNFYKESIYELRAKGGISPQDKIFLDIDYGITFYTGSSSEIEIIYKREHDIDGTVLNPIDQNKIDEIIDIHLNRLPKKLHPTKKGIKYDADIPVELLKITIKDDELQKRAKTKTNLFEATFMSEKAESEGMREDTHKLNKDLGVYYRHWEIRNLNLHQLIEVTKKEEPKRLKRRVSIIYWKGWAEQDLTPKSPTSVAQYIYLNYLPKKYSSLKTYLITKEDKLELDGYKTGGK